MSRPWYEEGLNQQRYWNYDTVHEFLYYVLSEIDKICTNNNIHYYLAYGSVLGAVRDGGIIPWDPDADIYVPAQEMKRFIDVSREQLPNDLYIDYYDVNPDYIYSFPRIGKKGFTTNGLHLDVFPLVGLPKGKQEKKFLKKYEWQRIWFGVIQGHWDSRINSIEKICQNRLFRRSVPLFRKILNKEKTIRKMEALAMQYSIFEGDRNLYDGYRIFKASFFRGGKIVKFNKNSNKVPYCYDEYLKQCYGNYSSYPDDRCFQSIIRSDYVKKDIYHKKTAFISDFCKLRCREYQQLEELYWMSGSIVAILDTSELDDIDIESTMRLATAIKYFDKVLVAYSKEEVNKYIQMIDPDHTVEIYA